MSIMHFKEDHKVLAQQESHKLFGLWGPYIRITEQFKVSNCLTPTGDSEVLMKSHVLNVDNMPLPTTNPTTNFS